MLAELTFVIVLSEDYQMLTFFVFLRALLDFPVPWFSSVASDVVVYADWPSTVSHNMLLPFRIGIRKKPPGPGLKLTHLVHHPVCSHVNISALAVVDSIVVFIVGGLRFYRDSVYLLLIWSYSI